MAKSDKAVDILKLSSVASQAELNLYNDNVEMFGDSDLKIKLKKSELNLVPGEIFKKIKQDLPVPIMKLKLSLKPGKAGDQTILYMWRSTVDFKKDPKPVELKYSETFMNEPAQKNEKMDPKKPWELIVFKKEGTRYLVGGYMSVTNTNAASYSPDFNEGRVYSWIDVKNVKVEELPADKDPLERQLYNGFPLTIDAVYTAVKNETIKGQMYTVLRVDLLMVDPLTPEQSNDPALKTRKYKLREVWVRSFDKDRRINFWLTTRSGS